LNWVVFFYVLGFNNSNAFISVDFESPLNTPLGT